jgi:hypothetical protein
MMLVLNLQFDGSIMHTAVSVIVVTHSAVQHVVAEDRVISRCPRSLGAVRKCSYLCALLDLFSTGANEFSVDFDKARIAAADRPH